jgi:hypothetical protein
MLAVEEHGGRQAHHARHLLGAEPTLLERAASGVGPICGELPIAVVAPSDEPLHVGVATQADAVRHGVQIVRELVQDRARVVLETRAAQIEHRPILCIDDLDAQPLGGDVEQQLILERAQRLALLHGLAQILHERLEPLVLARLRCLQRLRGLGLLRGRRGTRRLHGHHQGAARQQHTRRLETPVQIDRTGARAARPLQPRSRLHAVARLHARVLEVVADRSSLLLRD